LRRQAEERIREKTLQLSENLDTLSPQEQRQLLNELRVHQIKLEMQNESLRRTQGELESSRVRYFNLYNLAPVGYFTLERRRVNPGSEPHGRQFTGCGEKHFAQEVVNPLYLLRGSGHLLPSP